MVAGEKSPNASWRPSRRAILIWLNLAVTLLLLGIGIWTVALRVGLSHIADAMKLADLRLILLGAALVLFIVIMKVWRWRLILTADSQEFSLLALFWATALGNYVNLLLPLLRAGDFARAYAFKQQTSSSGVRALATIAVEKTLNLVMIFLTMVVVFPFLALPDFVTQSGITLGIVSIGLLLALYVLAYRAQNVLNAFRRLAGHLPTPLAKHAINASETGLDGVAVLRNQRRFTKVVLASALIACVSVVPPYLLLLAFRIPLGLAGAALLNVVATIALTPPSTPAKIGVFDGAILFALVTLGLTDEVYVTSYTIVYHLVVVLPLVVIGAVAASQTKWRWRMAGEIGNLATHASTTDFRSRPRA